MVYFISFLEGIITFISPCLLPMLPMYLLYFAGDSGAGTSRTVKNVLGFILGFSLVFMAMGAASSAMGSFLLRWQRVVDIVGGLVVIVFGLNFMGLLSVGLLNRTKRLNADVKPLGFFSALLFGLVFALGWTPCVGAFLGTALLLASQSGSVLTGMGMLGVYCLGLGLPFLLSALLMEQLKGAFDFIKRHYLWVNRICGGLLVVVGVLMCLGKTALLFGALSL